MLLLLAKHVGGAFAFFRFPTCSPEGAIPSSPTMYCTKFAWLSLLAPRNVLTNPQEMSVTLSDREVNEFLPDALLPYQ